MIRKWFILGVLSVATLALLWDFVTEVMLYKPFAELRGTGKTAEVEEKSSDVFKPAWGTEILEKNLFTAERRSSPKPDTNAVSKIQPAAPPAPVPPPPQRPNITLNGIIVNQFGEHVAVLQIDNEEAVPMRKGDELSGIRVLSVSDRSVALIWQGEAITLKMENFKTLENLAR